ncbi:MAG: leucine-rich repeat protein [Eubacterium sp.]|nr:leucine-rich repeat protein [Eubacterium sp.]
MRKRQTFFLFLLLALLLSAFSVTVFAAGETKTDGYVLMNIPYDKFYEGEGVSGVDAVSTATVKTFNQSMAAGTYHDGYAAPDPISDAKILGVTYPVYISDTTVLKGCKQVKDDDTATITVANGKSATMEKEVSGSDLLFASGDYAYYVLADVPSSYKTLSVEDGSFSFSKVSAEAQKASFTSADVTYNGHYTDICYSVADETNIEEVVVNGIIITADGEKYALRHVEDIWRLTSLGWNWTSLDGKGLAGKTITNVTYYVNNKGNYGVFSYDVNTYIKPKAEDVTAEFAYTTSLLVKGLPSDIKNPKATITTVVGRGETATVIADAVDVTEGKVTTTAPAENGLNYSLNITSDNYADILISPIEAQGLTAAPAPAAEPQPAAQPQPTPAASQPAPTASRPAVSYPAKGAIITVGNYKYQVTNANTSGNGTVSVTGLVKKKASISIPNTITYNNGSAKVTYKVTAIAKNAFAGNTKATKAAIGANVESIGAKAFKNCSKLKTLTIKSKKLTAKKVAASAFKGAGASKGKKLTVKVPKAKKKAYKKFLTKKGISKKAKIK